MTEPRSRHHPSAVSILYVAAAALIASLLFVSLLGREGFNSHEGSNPYYRVLMYAGELRDGHWPPQTFPQLFRGAGFAFPRFYAPLGNLVAVALTALTGDVIAGVHLSYLLSIVLSALAMYALLVHVVGSRPVALLGAFAYVSFPYRFEDVFVRGALAECWSFVWYPLIVLGGWRVLQGARAPWFLPLAFAGLVLSHPQMAMYFTLVSAVLVLVWRPRPTLRQLAAVAAGAILGLGLAAWYWLPQQYYLPSIWASVPRVLWSDIPHVDHARVSLLQSVVGRPERNGMSLSVGLVGLLANALVVYGLVRPAKLSAARVLASQARWLLIPWWLLLGFMVWPAPVLSILPRAFAYIQFPWRVLGPMGFFAAASLGCSLAAERNRWLTTGMAVALVLAVFQAGLSPHTMEGWTSARFEQRLLTRPVRRGLTGSSEYLPRTVPGLAGPYERAMQALGRRIVGAPYVSPGLVVKSFTRRGSSSEVVLEGPDPGTVILPIIYYDFYSATRSDGVRVTPDDSLGLLALTVPEGRHTIRIEERLTPVYYVGFGLSLVSAVLGMAYAVRRRSRRRTRAG